MVGGLVLDRGCRLRLPDRRALRLSAVFGDYDFASIKEILQRLSIGTVLGGRES